MLFRLEPTAASLPMTKTLVRLKPAIRGISAIWIEIGKLNARIQQLEEAKGAAAQQLAEHLKVERESRPRVQKPSKVAVVLRKRPKPTVQTCPPPEPPQ